MAKAEAAIDELKDAVTVIESIVDGLQPVSADR